jgi:TPP-dependent pyruvate/acetoin dehydrogenase alpha subunit
MQFSKEDMIKLYTNLVRTRMYDQAAIRLLSQGKLLGFFHPAFGGEAPGVGGTTFLRQDDYVWSHHRGHGIPHMVGKGVEVRRYLAEHCGKATGCCNGLGGFHAVDPEHGFLGTAGTLGSGFAVTAGWGLAAKKNGKGQVAVCFFGDGTSGRGTFHEAALMAANWKLPIVWVCENNGVGMFVSVRDAHPTADISSLAAGYGMPSAVVDGQDVIAVAEAVGAAVERARAGKGPSMVECKTMRWMSHAVGIPDLIGTHVRAKEEIEELKKRDPIELARKNLLSQGILSQEDVERIDREIKAEEEEMLKFIEESPFVEPSRLARALYAD